MSSLTGSNPLPFGARRRLHPLIRLGAATLGSLVVIAAGATFLGEAVSTAAANAPLPRTDRQGWYVPSENKTAVNAATLDISLTLPVKADLPQKVEADFGVYTYKVGVESLKVRSGPNKSADQLFSLKGGTAVQLGETRGGWVQITTEDGRAGWVYAKLLNPRQG